MVNEQFQLPPSFLAQRDESAEVHIQKGEGKKRRDAELGEQQKEPESLYSLSRRKSPHSCPKANQPHPLANMPLFLVFTRTHGHPEFYPSPDSLISCFLQATGDSLRCQNNFTSPSFCFVFLRKLKLPLIGVSWSSLSTALTPKNVVNVFSINSWLLRTLLVQGEPNWSREGVMW